MGTVCELSLVIIQAACLTHMGYTTIQYIYSSSEWITDKCGLSLCFSLSVLHPIHSSAHVLMSENRLFPRADIAAPFFGTRDTLRWWFRAAPAAAPSQQGICRLCTEHVRGASSCKTGRFSWQECGICRRRSVERYESCCFFSCYTFFRLQFKQ